MNHIVPPTVPAERHESEVARLIDRIAELEDDRDRTDALLGTYQRCLNTAHAAQTTYADDLIEAHAELAEVRAAAAEADAAMDDDEYRHDQDVLETLLGRLRAVTVTAAPAVTE
jgi:chromosome segregation ATPase